MYRLMALVMVTAALGLGTTAMAASPSPQTDMKYPVCDRTHTDSCLELGRSAAIDRELNQTYPNCAKVKGKQQKAACINEAVSKS
ncbi:MAG TPA: hypothetical protein VMC10_06110 [Stellaceae bacterium]|nr:hypothetical protein [Stellaceae bacterium]